MKRAAKSGEKLISTSGEIRRYCARVLTAVFFSEIVSFLPFYARSFCSLYLRIKLKNFY